MKKSTTLFMFLMLCFSLAKATTTAETDPNNVWNQANTVLLGDTGTGTAGIGYDEDWWTVATPGDGKLTVNWSSTNGGNVYCQIYDTLGVVQFATTYTNNSAVLNVDGLAKGNYYMRFIAYFNTESTNYSFSPTFTPAPVPNDPEPNGIFAQAATLGLNDSAYGHIGYYHNNLDDTLDWWKVTTNLDGRLDYTITSLNGQNIFADLFSANGTTSLAGNYTNGTATYSRDGLAPGIYYIRIKNYYNYEFAPYQIKNNLVLPPNNAETGGANGVFTSAIPVNLDDSVNGHIGYSDFVASRDTIDWYKFTTTSDGQINLKINVFNGQNVFAYLIDGDGSTVLTGTYSTSTAVYSKDGLRAGAYYIKIVNYFPSSEFAPYAIKVTLNTTVANDPEPNDTTANAIIINLND